LAIAVGFVLFLLTSQGVGHGVPAFLGGTVATLVVAWVAVRGDQRNRVKAEEDRRDLLAAVAAVAIVRERSGRAARHHDRSPHDEVTATVLDAIDLLG